MIHSLLRSGAGLALAALLLAGCGGDSKAPPDGPAKKQDQAEKIEANLAKLSVEDRKLAEEQEFCPVMKKERLGAMGVPVKEMVDDKPVFVCCKMCLRKLRKSPEEYLATAEELRAKSKAAKKEKQ